ncbi:hypothetical protein OHA72_62805 [Dactylosporangium sp. NBC_01737]|uniref:hypothetical protein n=1 Tax=Dactylosporangium sp. NBC_01737 TaxID=2975959 RepID=UPI002E0D4B1D|nr:hypothetical protein OHA72_62805 [Dactylosporangium sp. NBC_01737]
MVNVLDGIGFNALTLSLTVIGLAFTVIGVLYARSALYPPQRRFEVTYESPIALVGASQSVGAQISLYNGGSEVVDPHILTIRVRNTGRFDITQDQFGGGVPLLLDLQAPIVGITLNESSPASRPSLRVNHDGSVLQLGPAPVYRDQVSTLRILTSCLPRIDRNLFQYNLIDAKLSFRRRDDGRRARWVAYLEFGAALILAVTIGVMASEVASMNAEKEGLTKQLSISHERLIGLHPSVTLSRYSAKPGVEIRVQGWNFTPGATLVYVVDRQSYQQVVADSRGRFEERFSIIAGIHPRTAPEVSPPTASVAEFAKAQKPNTILVSARETESTNRAFAELEIEESL